MYEADDFDAYLSEDDRAVTTALVGRSIESFDLAPDRQRITFHMTDGDVTLTTRSECCSFTWIESVDDPGALVGRIIAAEHIPMPNQGSVTTAVYRTLQDNTWSEPEVDYVNYYGLKIITARGRVVIDYRNDSNGYYGGSIRLAFTG